MADDPKKGKFRTIAVPQIERLREKGQDLEYEALRRILDASNQNARTLNETLGGDTLLTGPGEGYHVKGIISFTTADNVFSLPPPDPNTDPSIPPDQPRMQIINVIRGGVPRKVGFR